MIETGIIVVLLIFGWVQTDRLSEQKSQTKHWKEVASTNYEEWNEAVNANNVLKNSLESIDGRLQECNQDLIKVLDTINDWEENNEIQEREIERLENDLDGLDYSNVCRLPDNLDIEAYRTAED